MKPTKCPPALNRRAPDRYLRCPSQAPHRAGCCLFCDAKQARKKHARKAEFWFAFFVLIITPLRGLKKNAPPPGGESGFPCRPAGMKTRQNAAMSAPLRKQLHRPSPAHAVVENPAFGDAKNAGHIEKKVKLRYVSRAQPVASAPCPFGLHSASRAQTTQPSTPARASLRPYARARKITSPHL